uniref:Uncharacterized protein n=1 Tax=Steinernema glaseri TaxID=37863 RepID=A0A1I7YLB1_9BILA
MNSWTAGLFDSCAQLRAKPSSSKPLILARLDRTLGLTLLGILKVNPTTCSTNQSITAQFKELRQPSGIITGEPANIRGVRCGMPRSSLLNTSVIGL